MLNDMELIGRLPFEWKKLNNKVILISGGTGFIGSLFCDVVRYRNQKYKQNIKIISLSRHKHQSDRTVTYLKQDVAKPVYCKTKVDYVIHLASNTHPKQYEVDPVGTILTNVYGCNNLLQIAKKNKAKFVLASSVEIYGNCINKPVKEDYCGYIDCNTARSGYNESKRVCESLVQSYRKQYGVNASIARFSRVFGNDKKDDSKAINQFFEMVLNNKDIVMTSRGNQRFSYIYVADAVSALFKIMLDGKDGEAYNVAADNDKSTLKDLAEYIAKLNHKQVIIKVSKNGFASSTIYGLIDNKKLKSLGWKPIYTVKEGLKKTYNLKSR